MVKKTGLVLGKFMPLHRGHIALVEFALQHCNELIVLLCASEKEPIPGSVRKHWLRETFESEKRVRIVHVEYDENELPNTSVSSLEVSKKWADYIWKKFPGISMFFSSEPYGEYVADHLRISHFCFDQERKTVPVSASAILSDPFTNWEYISLAARPYFGKKICISGSESTGKSTLAINLAKHYNTPVVEEMAREVIEKTNDVVFEDLMKIATLHAETINKKMKLVNKILICDTDVNITKSYSKYLFKKPLVTPQWIDDANQYGLHLYLETDCPFVQDGTRLSKIERDNLDAFHKTQLREAGIDFVSITGNWEERFEKAVAVIDKTFFNK
jgi:HTH-type transcriptional regulator, transcriptional repressor of NAD biosynthesis genes